MDARREPVSDTASEPRAQNGVLNPAMHDTRPSPDEADMPLPHEPRTIFLGGLFFIACLVLLSVGREVIQPITIALVLKLLLQPLVRLGERFHVPKALGAVVAVLLLLGAIGGLGAILSSPASNMVRNFPDLIEKVRSHAGVLQRMTDHVSHFLAPLGISAQNPLDMLNLNPGNLAGAIAGGASSFASHLIEILVVLFYMLAFGETFMRRLVEVLPRFKDKKQAVEISGAVERDISAYLLTITIINAVVGALNGTVMWLFGVPGGLFWGVVAFAFNYVPILGPLAGVLLFALVGLAVLGASGWALLPAAAYLTIHFAEGEMITPMLLARRFTLNPVAVIIALIFWYWMWGVQGAILSVPLLAITKIVADRLHSLRAVGHLLEG